MLGGLLLLPTQAVDVRLHRQDSKAGGDTVMKEATEEQKAWEQKASREGDGRINVLVGEDKKGLVVQCSLHSRSAIPIGP